MSRLLTILGLIIFTAIFGSLQTAGAINYSSGTYGSCTYNTCSIGLASSGTVSLVLTPPTSSTVCSVQADSVTATTDSTTGYTVTMNDDDTTNSLSGGAGTIPATSGTAASPVTLGTNKWGYRIDSIAGFGTGPTSSLTNGSTPSVTFAAIPLSNVAGDTVRSTTTLDSGTVSTSVWYGACVNASPTSGTYSDSVVYTALVNT